MPTNEYHLVSRWRVAGTVQDVSDVVGDVDELARWWASVYLAATVVAPGDHRGVGRVVDLHTKGWLPYTIRWRLRVTESREPHGFTFAATGGFAGQGVWTFAQAGPDVDVAFDWRIRADKPLLRYLSPVLKPIFAANHRWAMARGEESLRLELARRRAGTTADRAAVPPPPRPTFPHGRRHAAGPQTR